MGGGGGVYMPIFKIHYDRLKLQSVILYWGMRPPDFFFLQKWGRGEGAGEGEGGWSPVPTPPCVEIRGDLRGPGQLHSEFSCIHACVYIIIVH